VREGGNCLFVAGFAGGFGWCVLRFHRGHVIALGAKNRKGIELFPSNFICLKKKRLRHIRHTTCTGGFHACRAPFPLQNPERVGFVAVGSPTCTLPGKVAAGLRKAPNRCRRPET
jgi:hypothetical protein